MNPRSLQKMVVEMLGHLQEQMLGMQMLVESLDLEGMLGGEVPGQPELHADGGSH